ncbi:cysteine hydrolase family protein [Streptomyces angustmyceticus]|uniref:cysteine hydrolase family protein n=1 Tax=Streptomyces angustmyceticus TaxID=285578 RepID=UPI000F0C5AEF|nr:T14 [Streptomyces sp.]
MTGVLVVVDMQNGFITPETASVVPTVVDLVERWEHTGRDVVFTRFRNPPGSPYERLMHWTGFRSAPENELIPELTDHAARSFAVVDKVRYSAFTEEMDQLVRRRGWTEFVICGIATEMCVLKTAVDAFERGFRPRIVTDASRTYAGDAAHEAGLALAARLVGAEQLTTVRALLGSAHSSATV